MRSIDKFVYNWSYPVSNLEPLLDLPNLLDIRFEELNDLDPATDISALVKLNKLENISMTSCGITTLSHFSEVKNLKYLNLGDVHDGNQISDVSALSQLPGVEHLALCLSLDNPVDNLDVLEGLEGLRVLSLKNSPIKSLPFLSKLNKIEKLTLNNFGIESVQAISAPEQLKELALDDNKELVNLDSLRELTNLETLRIAGSSKTNDATVSFELNNLRKLYLSGHEILSLDGIENLTKLTSLDITWSKVTSIEPVSKIQSLRFFNIYQKGIEFTGTLSVIELPNLRRASIYKGNMTEKFGAIERAANKRPDVVFSFDM